MADSRSRFLESAGKSCRSRGKENKNNFPFERARERREALARLGLVVNYSHLRENGAAAYGWDLGLATGMFKKGRSLTMTSG